MAAPKKMLFTFVLFFCHLLPLLNAIKCAHTREGQCEVVGPHGWCYLNLEAGYFDCDDQQFCSKQKQLKGQKISGCFKKKECCCNNVDYCNYGVLQSGTQTVQNVQTCLQVRKDYIKSHQYGPCTDFWCVAYILKDARDNQNVFSYHGCQSKSVFHYAQWQEQNKIFGNNTDYRYLQPFLDKGHTCSTFMGEDDKQDDGNYKACIEMRFQAGKEMIRGKMCCCHGNDECNAKLSFNDRAKKVIGAAGKNSIRKTVILFGLVFLSKFSL